MRTGVPSNTMRSVRISSGTRLDPQGAHVHVGAFTTGNKSSSYLGPAVPITHYRSGAYKSKIAVSKPVESVRNQWGVDLPTAEVGRRGDVCRGCFVPMLPSGRCGTEDCPDPRPVVKVETHAAVTVVPATKGTRVRPAKAPAAGRSRTVPGWSTRRAASRAV